LNMDQYEKSIYSILKQQQSINNQPSSPKRFVHQFRYNKYRSTFFPSIQTVKRQLCFEEEKVKKQTNLFLF